MKDEPTMEQVHEALESLRELGCIEQHNTGYRLTKEYANILQHDLNDTNLTIAGAVLISLQRMMLYQEITCNNSKDLTMSVIAIITDMDKRLMNRYLNDTLKVQLK